MKLIDWGLAEIYFPKTAYTPRVSTLRYKAPELLLNYQYYDYGIDAFWLDNSEPDYGVYDFENYRYCEGPALAVSNMYPQMYSRVFYDEMSKLGKYKPEGYFDYVVPPLEGLWWQEDTQGVDYTRKKEFQWISLIRLPEFVTKEVFDWAVREAAEKKQRDFSRVEFFSWEEGLCVQCMHIGPYDDEPATVAAMAEYAMARGYEEDFGEGRFHHEIYLSNVRRCKPERLKTVIRHPVRRIP